MPSKHKAGGCGCCGGTCWACENPTSLIVDAPDAEPYCCPPINGTYAFGVAGSTVGCEFFAIQPGRECNVCVFTASPTFAFSDTTPTVEIVGSDVTYRCCIQVSPSLTSGRPIIAVCDTKTFAEEQSPNFFFGGCDLLALDACLVQATVLDVVGIPTVRVKISYRYVWITRIANGAGIGDCTGSVFTWEVVDEYEMVISCSDITPDITYTGRTVTASGAGSSEDDTGFNWGYDPSHGTEFYYRFDLCDAATVHLA